MGHDIDDDRWDIVLPYDVDQNPSPNPETGQAYERDRQNLVNAIMRTFMSLLPSNYVSSVNGPWYTLQFQAMAEHLASFQLTAQEVFKDSDWDFTRPDFLWGVIGTLIFPDSDERRGFPSVDGDIDYRAFLHQMALLLLRGSTADVMEEGAGLLTEAEVTLLEKFLYAQSRVPTGAWTIDNQFEVEINVEAEGGTEFPEDPFNLQDNTVLIEEALKPAHVLYDYRFLFREMFGPVFEESDPTWVLESYYYDDARHYCYGAREIVSSSGETLNDRFLFTDTTLSFARTHVNGILRIESGVNAGTYEVGEIIAFPYGDDTTPRAYTTSPTGLSGFATVSGEDITDTAQDFGLAVEGEVLTFTEGPNEGSYRLETLLGSAGGPLGQATGPATSVRVSTSMLRLRSRMPQASVTGQSYRLDVDRLGVRTPKTITGEDVSEQFYE